MRVAIDSPHTGAIPERLTTRASPSAAFTASVIAAYIAIGVVAFWPVLPNVTSRLFGDSTDPGLTVWFFGWVAHALAHGQNPFFSRAMLLPQGVNVPENTSVPLLGALMTPITLIFGPLVSANLLMVLALPVSASSAFIVLRKWHMWAPAAGIGGLMYGFSPYMVGQGLGHFSLVFVPLPPLIALVVVSILQRHGPAIRLGGVLGLLLAAQFLISPEILVTTGILTALALLCVAIRYRARLSELVPPLLVPGGVAFAVATALLAYPAWMMIAGPQHFTGAVWGTFNAFHNDLLSFFVPGPLQRLSLDLRALGIRLIGASNAAESGGYEGIPLLLIAGAFAWRSRHRPQMQLALILFGAAALLSLGPYLVVDGRMTQVPLPDLLFAHLPLLDNLLPARISLLVDACLAFVIAFGLSELRRSSEIQRGLLPFQRRANIGAAIFLGVLVATQLPQWPYASQTAPVLPPSVRRAVPANDPIALTYPYADGSGSAALVWQAEDGFHFRLLEGYALHASPTGQSSVWPDPITPSGLQEILAAGTPPTIFGPAQPVNSQLVASTQEVLEKYDVRLLIVERSLVNSASVVQLFTRAVGRPQLSKGGFVVWASPRHSL